jgi:hypothetical protein
MASTTGDAIFGWLLNLKTTGIAEVGQTTEKIFTASARRRNLISGVIV